MSGCPICERGEPLDVIAERRYTWITAGADSHSLGYVCVVTYEIHGNTIPHLHAHLYQRFDDPPTHDIEAIRRALA